jgi:hypothetical protein
VLWTVSCLSAFYYCSPVRRQAKRLYLSAGNDTTPLATRVDIDRANPPPYLKYARAITVSYHYDKFAAVFIILAQCEDDNRIIYGGNPRLSR